MHETAPSVLPANLSLRTQTHELWDRLADYDAARVDVALGHLLEALCTFVGAENALWAGMARLSDGGGDPIAGWRPLTVRMLHPNQKLDEAIYTETRDIHQRFSNDVVAGIIAQAGRFRASRLCDVVPLEWFGSDDYRAYYDDCGRTDAIYVVFPVNADAESWFCIFRARHQPPFTPQERDAAAYALRGIKWFHRQLMLSHGLMAAGTPLATVERHVLQGLLTGQTEKRIAAELGQSHHTTHGHVSAIYRKFGVSSRAGLMALWLGTNLTKSTS